MSNLMCKCHNFIYPNQEKLDKHIYDQEYWAKNKEKTREIRKEKSKINYLENTQYYKENYIKNKEKWNKDSQIWYLKNREKHKIWMKEYHKTPQGKKAERAVSFTRRTREQNFSKITLGVIQEVYEDNIKKYGTLTCELCFKSIEFGQDSLEHFIPVSRYKEFPGKDLNIRSNLGVAHSQFSKENCNGHKSNKTLEEWLLINQNGGIE